MPSTFSGKTNPTIEKVDLEAFDADGKRVVVHASREAIDDYGLGRVQDAASDKFDRGELDKAGNVVLFTTDI